MSLYYPGLICNPSPPTAIGDLRHPGPQILALLALQLVYQVVLMGSGITCALEGCHGTIVCYLGPKRVHMLGERRNE